jgi:hypothetical protein
MIVPMDSINSLLKQRDMSEPDEIAKLKKYISDTYDYDSTITLNGTTIVIGVSSSSLVSSLRYSIPELRRKLNIEHKLIVRRTI